MMILLNGEARETLAQTVAALLRELQMPSQGIAVAINGSVVHREEHVTTILHEGAQIEIIRAVQGG